MKVRLRYAKVGRVRFTSHRDVARMWERALRRAGLPVSYTAGFSPRPQLSFGLALPTGCESVAEYVDVSFSSPVEVASLPDVLGEMFPPGVSVLAADIFEPGTPSLQQDVTSCTWEIDVPGTTPHQLALVVGQALSATELSVSSERKGRSQDVDVRPGIVALEVMTPADDGGSRLWAELATHPRGIRPGELAKGLGLEFGVSLRTCQWIDHEGTRREPLTVGAQQVVSISGRAS